MSNQASKVYANVIAMLGYRECKLQSEPLSAEAFGGQLNHYEYVAIEATRPASAIRDACHTVCLVVAPESKYATKTADFKQLIKKIRPTATSPINNLVFITEKPLTVHIEKSLSAFRKENPGLLVEAYEYRNFAIEVPRHVNVPRHTIVPEEKVREFCELYKTDRDRVPKIQHTDPMAVWLGLRPGQWVRIERVSENAGQAIAYRMCV